MTTSNYNASTDFLQKLANSAMLQVDNTRSMIWNLIEPTNDFAYLREPDFTYSVSKPSLGTPPKLSDVLDLGDTTDTRLEKLNADAAAWMDKFFPSMDKCLRELPEDWLCGVISGVKPFGQDATVFELVWHRARDRAYRTMATEQRQLEAAFTGRGFTLPPGAMVAALGEAAERADTAILDVNREQAIKDAEIKLEILKFAEQQALTYKLGILQALADFYRQWIALPDQDLERARLKAQALSSLYSALSSYYNVEVAFEELGLKAKQADVQTDLEVDRNRITNRKNSDASGKAAALANAARAFGDVASQAAASAGTLTAEIETL
ncbi:hypothetical protein ACFOJE_21005 [Azotobacter bryophylli]|uniref:Uncharacterized protein n=1 Tax=Azotobacter bryophylli TaxID=1986537 RepID=A0ABV7AZ46_9GAMM